MVSALAIALSQPSAGPAGPSLQPLVQARATVRIVAGVRVRFGAGPVDRLPAARTSTIRADGALRAAELVEFQ